MRVAFIETWHFEAVHTGTNSARESINPYLQLHVANDGRVEIMALAKARTTDADSVAVGGRTDVLRCYLYDVRKKFGRVSRAWPVCCQPLSPPCDAG